MLEVDRLAAVTAALAVPFATAPGSVHTGDACLYDGQCAEGPCLAAADDDRLFFCTEPCSGGDDCPDGLDCVDDACRHPTPSPGRSGAAEP